MSPRKRSRARVLWITVVATLFGVALALFPLKGRTAPAGDAGAPADVPPPKAGKKDAKPSKAPAVDAGAIGSKTADAGATADREATPPAPPPEPTNDEGLSEIPMGNGLPVRVNVGVFFLEVNSFEDTKGEFEGTVDVRLGWSDPRLAFPVKDTLRGYREFIGKAAEERLGKMWTPNVDVKNRGEAGGYVGRRLRIFPDGRVETITRTTAKYKVHVDAQSFPFDRQKLALDLIVRDQSVNDVLLRIDREDVEFSRAARTASLDGWEIGLVDLTRSAVAGWNGDRYSTVKATLFVDREPASSIASVFIPLIASLLIPLLALWMNKAGEDGFEVDAFELANMGIGGLFSVIALSFAIYSSNPIIASTDNTVTRLFGLNYATLAMSLAIVVTFFRYQLPRRWFGIHVQEELFHVLSWAIPLLSLATSVAFLLVAAA